MGCFSTCFRKSKRRKSRRPANPTPCSDQFLWRDECAEAVQPTNVEEQENAEILKNPIPDSIDELEEKVNISERKKVTFDLNVHFYEELPATDENHGNEEEKEEKEKIKLTMEKESNRPSDGSSSSSLISFPPNNYRYQNCRDSDDELDDEMVSDDDSDHDYMGDDEDEEGEDEANKDEDEDDESLFSCSMNSTNQKLATYAGGDEIKNFDSVLHPIENLTQWKLIKARANKLEPQNDNAKENKNSGQECEIPFNEEPVVKPNLKSDKANKTKSKNSVKEIAVDTSLSSWLAGAEAAATPSKSKASSVSVGNSPCSERTYSPKDFEDRPILGVLTVEDIRQFSATSTPRRSPSRSPDDMPIIGSVGSYWN